MEDDYAILWALSYLNKASSPETLVDKFRVGNKELLTLSAARRILAAREHKGERGFASIEEAVEALRGEDDLRGHLDLFFGPVARHTHPVALLPLRIETKFQETSLLIRWYPDQIAVDNHNPRLSPNEERAAANWATTAAADKPDAWRRLVHNHGRERAAWIRKRGEAGAGADVGEDRTQSLPTLPSRFKVRVYGRSAGANPSYERDVPVKSGLELPFPSEQPTAAWVHDFEQAVHSGMAVEIPLSPVDKTFIRQNPGEVVFPRIVVVGLKATNADEGQALFEGLLEAHAHTGGVELLSPGTPTHNTSANNAAYTKRPDDPAYEPPGEQPYGWGDGRCAGERLARALGVEDDYFVEVEGGGDRREAYVRDLHHVIWPATGDYLLGRLLQNKCQELSLTDAERRRIWEFFADFVRPGGPLPAIRVGKLVYGVAPAIDFASWSGAPGGPAIDAGLHDLILRAREQWREVAASSRVPRIGEDDDVKAELLRVLAMAAVSHALQKRVFVGRGRLEEVYANMGSEAASAWRTVEALSPVSEEHPRFVELRDVLDLEPTQQFLECVGAMPLIQSASVGHLIEVAGEIASADGADVIRACSGKAGSDPETLLEVLIRLSHAWLSGGPQATLDRLSVGSAVCNLAEPFKPPPKVSTRAGIDFGLAKSDDEGLAGVEKKVVEAPLKLPGVLERPPRPDVRRLLREAIDALSHRIDAWATAFATERLETLRADPSTARGLYLGAYGFVENLRQRRSAWSEGFFLSPSARHGASAAVLYSAYLNRRGIPGGNAYHVSLNSTRVRRALRMLAAAREGHEIGAFLGYAFERRLHESTPALDRHIDEFRGAFPLVAGQVAESASGGAVPALSVAARNVVDGRKLLEAWVGAEGNWATLAAPYPSLPPSNPGLVAALEHLVEIRDASADLLLQEAVYQTAQGNHERASAALEAMSGRARPPEIECVNTPSTGPRLTHRVCLVLPEADATSYGIPCSPRDRTEPRFGEWLRRILGDLEEVGCTVTYSRDGSGAGVVEEATRELSLHELGITALDVYYILQASAGAASDATEIEQRIAFFVRQTDPGALYEDGHPLQIDLGSNTTTSRTIADALYLVDAIRTVVADGAVLRPGALANQAQVADAPFGIDTITSLRARIEPRLTDIRWLARVLDFDEPETAACSAAVGDISCREPVIVEALRLASRYGVSGAVPAGPHDPDLDARRIGVRAELATRASTCCRHLRTLDEMMGRWHAIPEDTPGRPSTGAMVDELTAAAKALFGGAFVLVPEFEPFDATALHEGWNAEATVAGVEPPRIRLWMQQLAQVRRPLGSVEHMLLTIEAWASQVDGNVAPPQQLDLQILQYIPDGGEHRPWLALDDEERQNDPRPPHAICVGALTDDAYATGPPSSVAGFLLDQWQEMVPSKSATTNITFHYDRPGTQAPNCLLLAVAAELGSDPWQLDDLLSTVEDTLSLAKERLVDREAAPDFAGALPAIFLPQ